MEYMHFCSHLLSHLSECNASSMIQWNFGRLLLMVMAKLDAYGKYSSERSLANTLCIVPPLHLIWHTNRLLATAVVKKGTIHLNGPNQSTNKHIPLHHHFSFWMLTIHLAIEVKANVFLIHCWKKNNWTWIKTMVFKASAHQVLALLPRQTYSQWKYIEIDWQNSSAKYWAYGLR